MRSRRDGFQRRRLKAESQRPEIRRGWNYSHHLDDWDSPRKFGARLSSWRVARPATSPDRSSRSMVATPRGRRVLNNGLTRQMLRRKPLELLAADAEGGSGGLKRALGAIDLTALGIGAIVGAGIFVLTGVAAAEYAGPAIVASFVVSGFA